VSRWVTMSEAMTVACLMVLFSYMAISMVLARRRPTSMVSAQRRDLHWYVVVPALNEASVISNTIRSLRGLHIDPGSSLHVLVMDDASEDATGDVARSHNWEGLRVVRRELPDARTGKGDVLNLAYRLIREDVDRRCLPVCDVVIGIVDADGRLPAEALSHVGPLFDAPNTGGVQIQVRILNREAGWLTRCQDYEFLTFSTLVQSAREHIGSVGLGGNGQFTRLDALIDVAGRSGPWTDCLTEDLDLGLRLAKRGWRNHFTARTHVAQQGVSSLRRVTRQRTRWMQGHFQCWRHLGSILGAPRVRTAAAFDLCWYLAAPAMTLVLSVLFGVPAVLFAAHWAWSVANGDATLSVGALALAYALSFGPGWLMGLIYRRQAGDFGFVRLTLLVHVLAVYNYVWYVATWRAVARLLLGRNGWAKTAREPDPMVVPSFHGLEIAT
jgi:1,2-diacylglycerol 3-beta-glucosyltransferase